MGNKLYTYIAAEFDPLNWNVYFECPVYKIAVPREVLDYYLPNQYLAFSSNTHKNVANRYYFLSEIAAMFNRTPFDDYIDGLPNSMSFDYFLQKLYKENDPTIRYNFVITDDHIIFIRDPNFSDRLSRLLCKHITISSRAPYVRYAGEIWCNQHGYFVVNNSSGTYQPPDRSIAQMIQFFQYLSPNTYFYGMSFQNRTPP
ncbi:hypothetical protein I4U23_004407 [Adineta vaga]|nr:hypothetical protein I4U23_004407 [Adineta vaga]